MKNFIEALFKQNEVIDFRYKETTSLFVSTKFHSYFLFFFFKSAVSSTAQLVYHENSSVSSTFLFLFFLAFFKKRNGERGI